jgi:hypothetical protein
MGPLRCSPVRSLNNSAFSARADAHGATVFSLTAALHLFPPWSPARAASLSTAGGSRGGRSALSVGPDSLHARGRPPLGHGPCAS